MHSSEDKLREKSFRVRKRIRRTMIFGKSGALAHRGMVASLTVECALVLPLFLFLLLPLAAFPQTLVYQAEENLRLSNEARTLSAAAQLTGAETWIDLQKRGSYELISPGLPLPKVKIALRARVYPFTGYVPGSDDAAGDGSGTAEMVFVTEYQSVYHTHADCTHLSLSVYAVPLSAAKAMRNSYGAKYKPCPGFPKNYSGAVYLTEKGDYYYPSTSYGSLTRHVKLVNQNDLGDLCLCNRCAARDQNTAQTEKADAAP